MNPYLVINQMAMFLNINHSLLEYSVEHGLVSRSRSNRILQFRTGSGSDWISKIFNWIRYGYPNCVDHCSQMLNQRFLHT